MDSTNYYYSTLWVPTIFHKHLTPLLSPNPNDELNYDNIEISDGMGLKFSYLHLTLEAAVDEENPAKRNIWIGYRTLLRNNNEKEQRSAWIGERDKSELKYEKSLKLECIDARRNGLIQFRFELPESISESTPHPLISSKKTLTHAVYHSIKEIFHIHEFHKYPKDSIINPFGSEDSIELDANDNDALLHYLKHFETTLSEAASDISTAANNIKKKREEGDGKYLTQAAEATKTYLEKCSNMFGFGVYYRALNSSKYNISFKIDCKENNIVDVAIKPTENSLPVIGSTGIEKKHYQSAINIESCLNYINVIKNQFQDLYNSFTTAISLDNQQRISKTLDDFSKVQNESHKTLSELKELQTTITTQQSALHELQEIATTQQDGLAQAISNVIEIQNQAQETAAKWNKNSTLLAYFGSVMGLIGVAFAIYTYVTNASPVSRTEFESIIIQSGDSIYKSKNQELIYSIYHATDSIIESKNKSLMETIKRTKQSSK